MKSRTLLGLGLLCILLAACGSGIFSGAAGLGDAIELPGAAPVVGAVAPNFELQQLDGKKRQLVDYRGQVVMLNFWATWCPPCRLEMPTLQSRYVKHGSEFTILALNFAEPEELVREFAQELGLSFPILLDDDGVIQELYQVRGYPSSVFIDPDGIIRIIHIGIMTDGQLDGYLAEMSIGVE